MTARSLSGAMLLLLCCGGAFGSATAAEQFLITVLQSHDPVEVRALLGALPSPGGTDLAGPRRQLRTTGYRQYRHARWQVVASEGQAAFLSTLELTPQAGMPWARLTRQGPVPYIGLAAREGARGLYLQARRLGDEVELQIRQFSDPVAPGGLSGSGAGLGTVLHGRTGRWLDAGGDLVLERMPATTRGYGVRHGDPRRSRLLVRVDTLD